MNIQERSGAITDPREIKAVRESNKWCIVKFFEFLWEKFPIGSISLPIYSYEGKTKFSNNCSKLIGVFLMIGFLATCYFTFQTLGAITQIRDTKVEFKSNKELDKYFEVNMHP